MQSGYMSTEAVRDLMAVKEGRIIFLERQVLLKDNEIKELNKKLSEHTTAP